MEKLEIKNLHDDRHNVTSIELKNYKAPKIMVSDR